MTGFLNWFWQQVTPNIVADSLWAIAFGPYLRKHFKEAREHRAAQRASLRALHDKVNHIPEVKNAS